jgi:hypothetical protein
MPSFLSFPAPLPSNLIMRQIIPSFSSTRSMRTLSVASYLTRTLLIRILASVCSVLPSTGRGIM